MDDWNNFRNIHDTHISMCTYKFPATIFIDMLKIQISFSRN